MKGVSKVNNTVIANEVKQSGIFINGLLHFVRNDGNRDFSDTHLSLNYGT